MSLAAAKVVDIHAHVVLEECFGTAGTFGPELYEEPDGTPIYRIGDYKLRGVKYRGSAFMDFDVRVSAMDVAGIDWQLLSPNPLTYFHHIPAADAVRFCQRHNEALSDRLRPYHNRLGGAATLPMQDISQAIEALKYAVSTLGLKAAYIGTDMPYRLNDPAMDTFYETVCELDVPLFIHPAPAGIDGPAAAHALGQFELDIMAGFTAQETVAVASLLFGGVLHRFPKLDICISHGGGAIGFVWGRLESAVKQRKWGPDHLQADGAFEEQLKRLWYDIHIHDDRSLELLAERVGTERMVYGTNFAGWDAPKTFHAPTFDAALADNARRLLRA